jgi:hypothetical protein
VADFQYLAMQMNEAAGRLSIMQPYIFPYIGYFHLIQATEKIVFYDDVNYIKRGWINRNRILLNGKDHVFTIPVSKASQNKQIREIEIAIDEKFRTKFVSTLLNAYKKAPFYKEVITVVEKVLEAPAENISELAITSICSVYDYLGKNINWTESSSCCAETIEEKKGDRLIAISKNLGYDKYVNSIGGMELYVKDDFAAKGVNLSFVKSKPIAYDQGLAEFIPNLSIIDILMFNPPEKVWGFFHEFELI